MNIIDNLINSTDQAMRKYISRDSDLRISGLPLLLQVKNNQSHVMSNTANPVTARAEYLTEMNNVQDESKQADHLFECVTELQNNPDSLLTAGSTKFIKIETGGKKITLQAQEVKLPSGRRIYVGYYQHHRVVSYGDVYHMCDVIRADNQTVVNSVGQLLAQIVGDTSYFLKALSNRPISNNSVLQPSAEHNGDGRMATADEYPQNSLSLQNHPPFFNTRAKRSVTGPLELRRASTVNPEIPDPEKITFDLLTETLVLSVPNKLGLRIMYALFEELKSTRPETTNDLSSLIAFDEFTAAKVVAIFSEGLFLKHNSKAADMILIKRRIENALNDHKEKETTLMTSKVIIGEHYLSQLRVAHFLSGLLGRLGTMIYKLDLDLIGAFVDYKNKLSYDETTLKLNEDLKFAIEENQLILLQFHNLLAIMNSAHNNFRQQLQHDATGAVFEKILYISDLEIYESLLNDRKYALNEMLIKRLFYYIFENTRIHGISIYSNFLIIPQDLTNNWRVFESNANENEIEEDNIRQVFNEEMIHFISSNEKNHSHIDKILKLSQLVLDEKTTNNSETLQYESGFVLADEVKEILEHRINRFNSEPNQLNYESQWRRAFSSELHHDQECYIMVNYIINLQMLASDMIDEMWRDNLKIDHVTTEQRIAEAKINAVRLIDKHDLNEADDESLLYEYKRRVENGDMKLFLKAAIYWYFSDRIQPTFVEKKMVFTYIIKQFREQELLNAVMFKQRTLESYTRVSEMRHSNEMENLEDYYNQFVEYKYHDMFHEARDLTMRLLNQSSLSYLEIIRTPKEIYTFKIKSRNYVQNTLATQVWVSDPIENIGYISLVQTYCDKYYFISTISSVDYIVKHQRIFDNVFIQHLIKVWKDNDTKNGHPLSVKISATQQELLSLYFKENITDEKSDLLINMVIKSPESNRNSNPSPDYELWSSPEVNTNLPLIEYVDSLNEKTLTEICNILKVTLRDDTWIDKIGGFIPFFSVLWQHWHDSEHNIEFKDIIFDIFDTLMVIFNSAITLQKLTINAFVDALKLAKLKKIPKKNLKMFIARQIFISSPSIGFKSSKNVMLECSSLVNPIPLSHIIVPQMTKIFSKGVSQSIELTNKILKKRKEKIINSRSEWISNVDHSLILPDFGNLYSQKLDNNKKNYYVMIDNDYYKVQWLDDKLSWCIVKPHSVGDDTECIPIMSNEAGEWIAKSESFQKHYASIFDMDTSPVNKDIGLAAINFEPMQQLDLTFDKLSQEELTFRKRLNFFITSKQDVLEKLHTAHTPTARIISHLHSYLTDENAMINQALTYKNSYNKPLIISDVAKISHDFERKSFFRAIKFWRNEHDVEPLTHIVIILPAEEGNLIIDPKAVRPEWLLEGVRKNVFGEREWQQIYRANIPKTIQLIKFKDVVHIHDAENIVGGEYKLPQQIIPYGRLLREPIWYQKIISRLSNHYFSIVRPLDNIERNPLRTSVRLVIGRSPADINHIQFSVNILFKSKIIPSQFKRSLQNHLETASRQATGIDEYLYDAIQIKTVNEMQRIAEGKLVIFLSDSLLKHSMVSLGNGQFAGSGNNMFNPILSSSPSVIVIEEMGSFVGDSFQFIDKKNSALMFVGNVLGAKNTHAILMPSLPRKVSITYDRNGAPIVLRQNLLRQEILLGDDWDLYRDAGNPSSFILKAHGAPFNVNHHTAPELAHIIRGMVYSVYGVDDLRHFTRLELYTCYGGFGGIYSTAQILANELKIEVKSYPYKISEDIKRRHPHWFKIYRPITQSSLESDREYFIALDRLKRRHERLHELANILIRLRRRLISSHKRNAYIMLPVIYNHLVNVITQVEQVNTFCKTYDLAPQHEIELRSIIDEYNIESSDSDDIFLQCYMDVLHSIAPLKYLLHWFG